MFARLSKLLVLLAAVQILGGHWAVLQSVAWVGMMIRNCETVSVRAAVVRTFDGAHPCLLCKAVQVGQKEEQKEHSIKLVVKLEAVLPHPARLPLVAFSLCRYEIPAVSVEEQVSYVPTPPPRVA